MRKIFSSLLTTIPNGPPPVAVATEHSKCWILLERNRLCKFSRPNPARKGAFRGNVTPSEYHKARGIHLYPTCMTRYSEAVHGKELPEGMSCRWDSSKLPVELRDKITKLALAVSPDCFSVVSEELFPFDFTVIPAFDNGRIEITQNGI